MPWIPAGPSGARFGAYWPEGAIPISRDFGGVTAEYVSSWRNDITPLTASMTGLARDHSLKGEFNVSFLGDISPTNEILFGVPLQRFALESEILYGIRRDLVFDAEKIVGVQSDSVIAAAIVTVSRVDFSALTESIGLLRSDQLLSTELFAGLYRDITITGETVSTLPALTIDASLALEVLAIAQRDSLVPIEEASALTAVAGRGAVAIEALGLNRRDFSTLLEMASGITVPIVSDGALVIEVVSRLSTDARVASENISTARTVDIILATERTLSTAMRGIIAVDNLGRLTWDSVLSSEKLTLFLARNVAAEEILRVVPTDFAPNVEVSANILARSILTSEELSLYAVRAAPLVEALAAHISRSVPSIEVLSDLAISISDSCMQIEGLAEALLESSIGTEWLGRVPLLLISDMTLSVEVVGSPPLIGVQMVADSIR